MEEMFDRRYPELWWFCDVEYQANQTLTWNIDRSADLGTFLRRSAPHLASHDTHDEEVGRNAVGGVYLVQQATAIAEVEVDEIGEVTLLDFLVEVDKVNEGVVVWVHVYLR